MNNFVLIIKLIKNVGIILCASITIKNPGMTNIKIKQIVKKKRILILDIPSVVSYFAKRIHYAQVSL
jgi:hypothetical protein